MTSTKDIELGAYHPVQSELGSVVENTKLRKRNTFFFDVSFYVKQKDKKRMIVDRVSDIVQSGQMLAIMGPSGAGKTSLLRILTMEAFGGVSEGTVTFNGMQMSPSLFKAKCGLVAQEDYHWAFLTCRETISFAADLLLAGMTVEEKKAHVNNLITKMGLDSCADTLVGNAFIHGLSGGQKRRLSIAVAILKRLELIFLDEPTSGLDAAAAAGIMEFIGQVTKEEQLITIFTVHQPSTNIYNSFDRIMLLSKGRIAFNGVKNDVTTYLGEIGYPLPDQTNPAEFMLDIVNTDFTDDVQVEAILSSYDRIARPKNRDRIDTIQALSTRDDEDKLKNEKVSVWEQTAIMFRRHGLLSLRDPLIYSGRIVMFFFLCIFFAIIYIDGGNLEQDQALNHLWLGIWCIGVPSNAAVIAVYVFNTEFKTIKKEIKNGMVDSIPYLFSNSIIQIPMMFLMGIFAISVAEYGMMNYNRDHYGQMLLLYGLAMYSYESIAQLLSIAFDNPLLGMLQYVNLWFASFLFCGLFLKIESITWPFRVFSYILPFRYTARSMAYVEYDGTTWDGAHSCSPDTDPSCSKGYYCNSTPCYGRTGLQVLDSLQATFPLLSPEDNFAGDVGILIAIAIVCKVIFVVAMAVKSRVESSITPKVSDPVA
eukprot:gene14936-16624_t